MSLPNELLTSIFLYLHEMTTTKPGEYGWITICRVCHRWYQVAVHFPSLWSKIPSVRNKRGIHVDHIPLMVQRSGSFPLSIYIDLTARIGTMEELEKHHVFDRLVSVHFCWGILPPFMHDRKYEAMNAPLLRELNLYGALSWPRRPTTIPFLRGEVPLLATLRILEGHFAAEMIPLFRDTITHLELSAGRMPTNTFYEIFHEMPNLQFLSLIDTLPLGPYKSVLPLRRLQRLRLVDVTRRDLGYFDICPDNILSTHVRCSNTLPKDPGRAIPFLMKDLVSMHSPVVTLCFKRQSRRNVEISAWTTPHHGGILYDEAQIQINLNEDEYWNHEDVVQEVCGPLRSHGTMPTAIYYIFDIPGVLGDLTEIPRDPSTFSVRGSFQFFLQFDSAEYFELSFIVAHGFLQMACDFSYETWKKLQSFFVKGSNLRHWTKTGHIFDRGVLHPRNVPFPTPRLNLKTLVITGAHPRCVAAATDLLRNAIEYSEISHHVVNVVVKP